MHPDLALQQYTFTYSNDSLIGAPVMVMLVDWHVALTVPSCRSPGAVRSAKMQRLRKALYRLPGVVIQKESD